MFVNFTWNVIGIIAYRSSFIGLAYINSQNNTHSEYGIFSMVLLYISAIQLVFGSSLQLTTTKLRSNKRLCGKRSSIEYGIFLAVIAGLLMLAHEISFERFMHEAYASGTGQYLYAVVLGVNLTYLGVALFSGVLIEKNMLKEVALAQISFFLFCIGWAFLLNSSVVGLVNCILMATALAFAILLYFVICSNMSYVKEQFDNSIKSVFFQSIELYTPLLLSSAIVAPAHLISANILAVRNGFAESAIYTTALQWFATALLVPTAIGNSLFPTILLTINTSDGPTAIMAALKRKCYIATILVLFISIIFTPYLIELYRFGNEDAFMPFIVVILAGGLAGLQIPNVNLILASGKFTAAAILNTSWSVMYICMAYAFVVQQYSVLGVAAALFFAYVFQFVATQWYSKKLLVKLSYD